MPAVAPFAIPVKTGIHARLKKMGSRFHRNDRKPLNVKGKSPIILHSFKDWRKPISYKKVDSTRFILVYILV